MYSNVSNNVINDPNAAPYCIHHCWDDDTNTDRILSLKVHTQPRMEPRTEALSHEFLLAAVTQIAHMLPIGEHGVNVLLASSNAARMEATKRLRAM